MLLIGLAFALTYTESFDTFSTADVKAILVLGAAVNVPLLVGSLFLLRSFKLISNAILSLVVLASVATAYIIHTDLYAPQNQPNLIMVCVAAFFVLFVSFRVIDQQRWGGVTLSAVALIGLGVVLGRPLPGTSRFHQDARFPPGRWKSICRTFSMFHFARNPIFTSYPSSHWFRDHCSGSITVLIPRHFTTCSRPTSAAFQLLLRI